MKKLIALLAFICLTASAETDVQFTISDFTSTPMANRNVWVQAMSMPTVNSASILLGDIQKYVSDANGQFTVSNLNVSLYLCQIKAPPTGGQQTSFKIYVTSTNLGFVTAQPMLVADSTATFPAGTVAWSAASSDLRYAAFGTAGVAIAAGTNVIAVTNGSVVTISTSANTNLSATAAGANIVISTNGSVATVSVATNATLYGDVNVSGSFISENDVTVNGGITTTGDAQFDGNVFAHGSIAGDTSTLSLSGFTTNDPVVVLSQLQLNNGVAGDGSGLTNISTNGVSGLNTQIAALYPRSNPSNFVTSIVTNGLAGTNIIVYKANNGSDFGSSILTASNISIIGISNQNQFPSFASTAGIIGKYPGQILITYGSGNGGNNAHQMWVWNTNNGTSGWDGGLQIPGRIAAYSSTAEHTFIVTNGIDAAFMYQNLDTLHYSAPRWLDMFGSELGAGPGYGNVGAPFYAGWNFIEAQNAAPFYFVGADFDQTNGYGFHASAYFGLESGTRDFVIYNRFGSADSSNVYSSNVTFRIAHANGAATFKTNVTVNGNTVLGNGPGTTVLMAGTNITIGNSGTANIANGSFARMTLNAGGGSVCTPSLGLNGFGIDSPSGSTAAFGFCFNTITTNIWIDRVANSMYLQNAVAIGSSNNLPNATNIFEVNALGGKVNVGTNGVLYGNATGLTNINGVNISSGTINSNALDAPTKAQLALAGTGGGGSSITNTFDTNQFSAVNGTNIHIVSGVLTTNLHDKGSVVIDGTATFVNGHSGVGSGGVFFANLGNASSDTANFIAGGSDNTMDLGTDYAIIAGGIGNTMGVNDDNCIIVGGQANIIGAASSFGSIFGGQGNSISNRTIGGSSFVTIIGGISNIMSGDAFYSTIIGSSNLVTKPYSFAVGQRAKSTNQGTFVWSDSQGSDFTTVSNDTFIVRATNGVGINTNSGGGYALNVNGTINATAFAGTIGSASGSGTNTTLMGVNLTNTATIGSVETNLIKTAYSNGVAMASMNMSSNQWSAMVNGTNEFKVQQGGVMVPGSLTMSGGASITAGTNFTAAKPALDMRVGAGALGVYGGNGGIGDYMGFALAGTAKILFAGGMMLSARNYSIGWQSSINAGAGADASMTSTAAGSVTITTNLIVPGTITATNGVTSLRSNLVAPSSITFPATTVNWTNTNSFNIQIYIDNSAVTGTAIKKNGGTIFTSITGDATIGLQPNETFSETYTVGTPTATWSPF